MMELNGIFETPGMGSLLLVFVFFCYLIVSKIFNARKKNNEPTELQAEGDGSSQAAGAKNTKAVIAAITAAVTEYRKYN